MSLPLYLLERVYLPDRALGSIYSPQGGLICKTLELKWANNDRGVSCIPEGLYKVTKEQPIPANDPLGRNQRKYIHFRVHQVPKRDGILIHIGNDPSDSKGCILVGSRFGNYNTEFPTVEDSTAKMKFMTDTMPDVFRLRITKK